jgi:tetratricopeptide (TPR) repeat protein
MRRLFVIPLLAALLSAAEPGQAVAVPEDVARVLSAAQAEPDSAKSLALLEAYKGADNALVLLAKGQALTRVAASGPAAEREQRRDEAVAALTAALKLDPSLRQAQLALAQVAAARGAWSEALARCGAGMSLNDASAPELQFYTQCAWQARDWRLATTLVTQGIARYPAERAFRRYELALLVNGDRSDEARQAVLALLDGTPEDTELWRHLSWAAHETHRDDEALAALEIALISAPGDAAVRRQLAQAQLGAAMPQAALATVLPLVGDTPTAAALGDGALMELAARIAGEAGDAARGRAWLAAVPADQRTRGQRLLAARLALQAHDPAAATAALKDLVALGERDASVLAWAGQAAEQAGDQPAAEAFYGQAATGDQPAAATASLRLVALYLRQDRKDEARVLLATHLARHPDDELARGLQAQLARTKP